MSKITWGLTANGVRAKIVRGLTDERPSSADWSSGAHIPASIARDRPGRRWASGSRRRSGLELHADPLRACERQFAQTLSDYLLRELDVSHFDALVVSAAPRTLGDLRTAFAPKLSNCVVAESDRDYTTLPDREMIDALRGLLRR